MRASNAPHTMRNTESPGPCWRALVQIGEPSVRPVAILLENGNLETRRRAVAVLLNFGTSTAIQPLRNHIRKEKDSHLRAFIGAVDESGGAGMACLRSRVSG